VAGFFIRSGNLAEPGIALCPRAADAEDWSDGVGHLLFPAVTIGLGALDAVK
jgi:hypothetical protein